MDELVNICTFAICPAKWGPTVTSRTQLRVDLKVDGLGSDTWEFLDDEDKSKLQMMLTEVGETAKQIIYGDK